MPHSAHPSPSTVILLGDHDTTQHRDQLAEQAAGQDCVIAEVFSFPTGEVAATNDLGEVEAVVSALACAIESRSDIWAPCPGPDFGREQHWRRLTLVLQRHGLNLRIGRDLGWVPPTGGISDIDFALRQEVRAVDDLDGAALAAAGIKSLGQEIERSLAGVRPTTREVSAGSDACPAPVLPAPTVPWPQRQPMLKEYARWLVQDCRVTRTSVARILNATGQRTPQGRSWQPGSIAALLNSYCDVSGKVTR